MKSTDHLLHHRCLRRVLFTLLPFWAVAAGAASDRAFEAASKEATRNYGTQVGRNYRDVFMKIVEPKIAAALGPCSSSTPDTKKPAEIICIVGRDGRVKRVLSSPNSPFGDCVAARLRNIPVAPPPPYDLWPAAFGVANHSQEQRSAGPPDKPQKMATKAQLAAYDKAIAPHVAKARATYPAAKKRFLAGLPPGHRFYVRVPLFNRDGAREDSFVAVETIRGGQITGTINSQLGLVTDYKTGQRITFNESKIDNWLILRPDGTEEGNHVGKFLDNYRPQSR